MSEWAMKRFWTDVEVAESPSGYEVRLDGRQVRTPGKSLLLVPTETIAQRIAEEWRAQEKTVDPTTMPWTRSANSAIEKVAKGRDAVVAHLADYAGSDLLCYRADAPEALVARQAEAWDPVLDWAAGTFGARLSVTTGVMPVAQSPADTERLAARMSGMSAFQITGFHDLVTLSGSFLLGLCAVEGFASPEELWALSRVDEDWQIEQWGEDEEAAELAETKRIAFLHANDFFHSA